MRWKILPFFLRCLFKLKVWKTKIFPYFIKFLAISSWLEFKNLEQKLTAHLIILEKGRNFWQMFIHFSFFYFNRRRPECRCVPKNSDGFDDRRTIACLSVFDKQVVLRFPGTWDVLRYAMCIGFWEGDLQEDTL